MNTFSIELRGIAPQPTTCCKDAHGEGGSSRLIECGAYGDSECGGFGLSTTPIALFGAGECDATESKLSAEGTLLAVAVGHAAAPAIADFNRDGRNDVLVGGLDGALSLWVATHSLPRRVGL